MKGDAKLQNQKRKRTRVELLVSLLGLQFILFAIHAGANIDEWSLQIDPRDKKRDPGKPQKPLDVINELLAFLILFSLIQKSIELYRTCRIGLVLFSKCSTNT